MKRHNAVPHYETPEALRHDVQTLAHDAKALVEATAEIADEKVAKARRRLNDALEEGEDAYRKLRRRVSMSTQAADEAMHEHLYPTMAAVFSIGALVGFCLSRRS